jgi:two-component system cell cycle response regulator PopA
MVETLILGPDPRVLVVAATDDLAGSLCQGLDALGWRTMTARSVEAALAAMTDLAFEAAILEAPIDPSAVARLKAAASPRSLPVVVVGSTQSSSAGDAELVMTGPAHPAQLALRLEQLVRAAVAEEEFAIRCQTFASRDCALSPVEIDAAPLRILAAGAPDRRFLALSNALAAAGAETVAAPTPYTAFDYLHESAFDAVVLWGGTDHAPALSIASGMKRNTRLYHIPLVLYLRDTAELNLSEIYNRGVADVAASDTAEPETAARVLALARAFRRQQAVRRALESARGSDLMDGSTGLFTRDLFASHLGRVAEAARLRRRPLSACVLRVANTAELETARAGGWLDRAMPQIGAMVSRLVRTEDTAARLAPDVFALALPATRGAAARLTAERIAAVIGCTAFDAGPDRSPFVVEFEVGAAELDEDESAARLLERASADLAKREGATR